MSVNVIKELVDQTGRQDISSQLSTHFSRAQRA